MLKKEELKAPEGKFRLVLHDAVPALATGQGMEAYHWGDFDSLNEAVERRGGQKPEYGTSFVVYDDKGVVVDEDSAIPSPRVLF
mgnify:FL=1